MTDWSAKFAGITAGFIAGNDKLNQREHGETIIAALEQHGVDFNGAVVLDVGCGNGRLASALTDRDVEQYLGCEIVPACVAFCRGAFAEWWPRFQFEHVDIANPAYNPGGKLTPSQFRLNVPYRFNVVLASSVFTHFETEHDVRSYLVEIARVTELGGLFYSSWFTDPPNTPSTDARRRVFERWLVGDLLAGYGFEIESTWGGETTGHHDQLCMVARRTS